MAGAQKIPQIMAQLRRHTDAIGTEKIRQLKKISPEKLIIEVDGGINQETAKLAVEAGADALVAGAYVYGANDVKQAINSLKIV